MKYIIRPYIEFDSLNDKIRNRTSRGGGEARPPAEEVEGRGRCANILYYAII